MVSSSQIAIGAYPPFTDTDSRVRVTSVRLPYSLRFSETRLLADTLLESRVSATALAESFPGAWSNSQLFCAKPHAVPRTTIGSNHLRQQLIGPHSILRE